MFVWRVHGLYGLCLHAREDGEEDCVQDIQMYAYLRGVRRAQRTWFVRVMLSLLVAAPEASDLPITGWYASSHVMESP